MPTPAILNTSSVLPGSKPVAKQTDGAASDGAFNQMLSQQIADRRSTSNAEQARAANKPREAAKAKDKPANAGAADKGKTTEAKKVDDGATKTQAAATEDKPASTTPADANAAPPTATELLALAASGMLKPQTAVSESTVATPATTVPTAADGDAITLAGNEKLLAAMDRQQQAAADTALGNRDFRAALNQASELGTAASHADGKALDKLAELPVAEKMLDTPAANGTLPQLQQSSAAALQAAAGKPTDRLTPHVGTPAWNQAVGQKVVWMVAGAHQSASLTLNPPDLGPLQVVLNVTNGHTDAAFYAAQPEVRQALEAALPKLREMMSESGIELGQTSVSAGMPDQHNQPGESPSRQASRGGGKDHFPGDAAAPVTRTQTLSSGQGLVDTFA